MEEIKKNETGKETENDSGPKGEKEMTAEEEQAAIEKAKAELQKTVQEGLAKTRAMIDEANMAIGEGKGRLKLETKIKTGDGETVEELVYDFTEMTGIEYADAMDSDRNGQNAYKLTKRQALALFAKAAAKNTDGLDMNDIMANIGMTDSVIAAQTAELFFQASQRAGRMRITRK